jgi:hypothetical protein
MIQSTDHKKLKKKGDPSENASIPCRRENKIITGGRGKKGTVLGGGDQSRISYWGNRREVQKAGRMNANVQLP